MDQIDGLIKEVIHLVRFGTEGRSRDVRALARRMAYGYRSTLPELSEALSSLVVSEGALRGAKRPLPVDADSRMALARVYDPKLAESPVLPPALDHKLRQIIAEHKDAKSLQKAGLSPTKTALLIGPPGVGKTMAAHWLASQLGRPLVVLDLASSVSSFLGKTGQNVRQVFDFVKEFDCVLLLDEVDAIAKRRSDETDLGELKRLVNVLLQELDEWPEGSLLLAATNHSELLDPAVWRRFDVVLDLPLPGLDERLNLLHGLGTIQEPAMVKAVAELSEGMSGADIVNLVRLGRKVAVLAKSHEAEGIAEAFAEKIRRLPTQRRSHISESLIAAGISQRKASEITGTSRNTIRKRSSGAKKS